MTTFTMITAGGTKTVVGAEHMAAVISMVGRKRRDHVAIYLGDATQGNATLLGFVAPGGEWIAAY